MQVLAAEEKSDKNAEAIDKLTELLRQSAKQRGKLIEGQETLKSQGRLIQDRLWEIKQQNNRGRADPPRR